MSGYKESGLRLRKKGEDRWSSPDRDIIELWPSAVVRGAAFVCYPGSDLNKRMKAAGKTTFDIRREMETLLTVINETKHGPLDDAIAGRVDPDCYHLIMAGAGGLLFKDFNYYYRASHFTDKHGGTRAPMEMVDIEQAMRLFDGFLNKMGEDPDIIKNL
jgi:hypothetical protein